MIDRSVTAGLLPFQRDRSLICLPGVPDSMLFGSEMVAAWAESSTHDVTNARRLSGKQYSALDHGSRVLGKPLIHQNHKDGFCLFHILKMESEDTSQDVLSAETPD